MRNMYWIFVLGVLITSCGTKTIKDDGSVKLKGPLQIKMKIDKVDSELIQGTSIKLSYTMPDSIIDADGNVYRNISNVDFGISPLSNKIDIANNSAYGVTKNFILGHNGDKSRTSWQLKKGQRYCEDTYVCRDTGVFWFSFVNAPTTFYFWTADGKYYSIPITQDFDVPDHHTNMLVRYCPSIEAYLNVMLDQGFGHYCFKVIP